MSKNQMSNPSKNSFSMLFIIFVTISIHLVTNVQCVELDVGGDKGWVTPSNKDSDQFFNDWASNNRFKVNDTLRFRYKKDSVLSVTQEEYEKCRSSHPAFFSNNGDTDFTLDHSGLYYFISGVSGHCERGLKMIIKMLEPESPPQIANQTASPPKSNGAAALPFNGPELIAPVAGIMLLVSFFKF